MTYPKLRTLLLSAVLSVCFFCWSACGGSAPSTTVANSSAPPPDPSPQSFSCPAGEEDVMQYFVMKKEARNSQFVNGTANPLYSEVFPDEDFAASGYWFWLKSPSAHGFDVDAFDESYIYLRSTELDWTDNTTFKRKHHDVPIAARCVPVNAPGGEIQVSNTQIDWYSQCAQYKSSFLGTIVNDLDAPQLMDSGGNIGQVMTRVLHYHYNCDPNFENCRDEEQFFLGQGYGQWQWKHYHDGAPVNSNLLNQIESGAAQGTLPCSESYR